MTAAVAADSFHTLTIYHTAALTYRDGATGRLMTDTTTESRRAQRVVNACCASEAAILVDFVLN
jgi:hypothetical protein